MSPRVLIADDDELLGRMLELNLAQAGWLVERAGDGAEALHLAATGRFDLLVLDVMLPSVNGFRIAGELRQAGVATPILMLSARDDAASRVRGLFAGADDYLGKPFELAELLARVRSLARRAGRPAVPATGGDRRVA